MNKWLSIAIPSKRPDELKVFIDSLRQNAVDFDSIEIIVLVDDDSSQYTSYNNVKFYTRQSQIISAGNLIEECYNLTTCDWILGATDDLLCETYGWDAKIKEATEIHKDQIALIYFDDGMFGESFACFPIISRKLFTLVSYFPQPYKKYKTDDTLFHIIPQSRRIYLKDVIIRHLHDYGKPGEGFLLPTGKIYPIDKKAADIDNKLWISESPRRMKMSEIIRKSINMDKQNKVLIAIPTQEFARRADFYDYFNAMEKPEGTICTFSHGQSPARNRNIMIDLAFKHNCTHIMFIDDDMAFKPTLIPQLLAHDKDIVSGLYLMRNYPHFPVMFDEAYEGGKCRFSFLRNGRKGLAKSVNCGLGAVLIKMEVFQAMEKPWITLGELEKDHWCDDIAFFNRCRALGFDVWVDLDCPVGHIMSAIIWPDRDEKGDWFTVYNTSSEQTFKVAQIVPSDDDITRGLTGLSVVNASK